MKNVLVTGAAGFLGSHLCMHYLNAGDKVWGVDNFCSSDPNSDHLKQLKAHERFTFIDADVCDSYKDWDLPSQIDLVLNFACPASPPEYQAMPVLTMMTCTVGTANMLDLAHEHGTIIVHASTSEVYGDPTVLPQHEDYRGNVNPYGPRACYDEGKRAAEALCYDYKNTYGVDARLVRIFNTYGPHMDPHDGRVVSNFICQLLKGEQMTIYGDGRQDRSFCYVSDLIRGIVAVGALGKNPGGPINLGNPNTFTVNALALRVAEKLVGRWPFPLSRVARFEKLPTDDPKQRRPDISKAKELLGWEPKVELSEGLDKTIEYFRRIMG